MVPPSFFVMKHNKHFILLIFSTLVLLGGCFSPTQQGVSDVSLKECIHFGLPMQHLCDTREDCLEANKKLAEQLFKRLDPDDLDYKYSYAHYQNLVDPDTYRCEPTELVPLLNNGQEIICTQKSDCSPSEIFFGISENDFPEDYPFPENEVLFCEDGICKITEYYQEQLQRIHPILTSDE